MREFDRAYADPIPPDAPTSGRYAANFCVSTLRHLFDAELSKKPGPPIQAIPSYRAAGYVDLFFAVPILVIFRMSPPSSPYPAPDKRPAREHRCNSDDCGLDAEQDTDGTPMELDEAK